MSKAGFLAPLALIGALTVAAPGEVRADPASWQHLCRGLGDFAGVLTDYRNQGRNLQEAVAAAFPELHVMPDRAVASEIAQQVYATPTLSRSQEVAAIYTKCVTPPEGETPRQSRISITDLAPIPLQPGPNHIERFAPDGRDANITLAWHDEGSGHGQDIFLVTMPNQEAVGWRSVNILQEGLASSSTMADEPHNGDDMLRSLRFARGRVNGENTALLLIANRAESMDSASSETVYEVYRLVQIDGRDGFARIFQQLLPGRYCNADVALSAASGLPLRSSYRGPRNVDGGFTKDGCGDPKAMTGRLSSATVSRSTGFLSGPSERSRDNQEQPLQQFSFSNDSGAHR